VIAKARRNPDIQTTQPGLLLEIGQTPDVGAILLYAGPPLNANNRLELSAALLTSGFGAPVAFAVNNSTGVEHNYTLHYFLTVDGGNDTGWSPITGSEQERIVLVSSQSTETTLLNFSGPVGENVEGTQGTLHVSLIRIDGADLPPADQETVNVDFIAI